MSVFAVCGGDPGPVAVLGARAGRIRKHMHLGETGLGDGPQMAGRQPVVISYLKPPADVEARHQLLLAGKLPILPGDPPPIREDPAFVAAGECAAPEAAEVAPLAGAGDDEPTGV